MKQYWNGIKISEIKDISGIGGSFGDTVDVYFTVTLNDDHKHSFHYNNRQDVYNARNEIKSLHNEFHEVPESYLFENEIHVEINGEILHYGCRMEDNLGNSVYKTNLEIAELRKQGKVRDQGWRHLAYICPIVIQNNKVMRGTINEVSSAQLKALGYEVEFEYGKYINGELVKEEN